MSFAAIGKSGLQLINSSIDTGNTSVQTVNGLLKTVEGATKVVRQLESTTTDSIVLSGHLIKWLQDSVKNTNKTVNLMHNSFNKSLDENQNAMGDIFGTSIQLIGSTIKNTAIRPTTILNLVGISFLKLNNWITRVDTKIDLEKKGGGEGEGEGLDNNELEEIDENMEIIKLISNGLANKQNNIESIINVVAETDNTIQDDIEEKIQNGLENVVLKEDGNINTLNEVNEVNVNNLDESVKKEISDVIHENPNELINALENRLESDTHVLPHTDGGNNTKKLIQLLKRRYKKRIYKKNNNSKKGNYSKKQFNKRSRRKLIRRKKGKTCKKC